MNRIEYLRWLNNNWQVHTEAKDEAKAAGPTWFPVVVREKDGFITRFKLVSGGAIAPDGCEYYLLADLLYEGEPESYAILNRIAIES